MAKKTYQIDIDGYIGEFYYSKSFVRRELEKYPNTTVHVRMNSLGGNLDHGLNIADRFADHGDVIVDLFGFNASAATLATLKAKKIRISSTGFYLIHKVMNWVDIWGSMNADQMAKAIQDLEDNKKENDKMDLVIAQMYSEKTGKPVNELVDIMKVGGWLSAQEAKDLGFVDEIIKSTEKTNMAEMANKLNSFGLPTNFISKNNFINKTNIENMKQFEKINATLKVENLESSDEGVFLNEAQLQSIEDSITGLEGQVSTGTTNSADLQTKLDAATSRADAAEAKVTEKDNTIADLNTQIENLKKGAGDDSDPIKKQNDGNQNPAEDDDLKSMKAAREIYDLVP